MGTQRLFRIVDLHIQIDSNCGEQSGITACQAWQVGDRAIPLASRQLQGHGPRAQSAIGETRRATTSERVSE